MSGKYSGWATQIETAIDAVLTALADGKDTVEYEIRGRRHRMVPSVELLDKLEQVYARVKRRANQETTGPFRLARLSRPSKIGS